MYIYIYIYTYIYIYLCSKIWCFQNYHPGLTRITGMIRKDGGLHWKNCWLSSWTNQNWGKVGGDGREGCLIKMCDTVGIFGRRFGNDEEEKEKEKKEEEEEEEKEEEEE